MYEIKIREYHEGDQVTVISVAEMREADSQTIEGGVASIELMRRAAQGVFEAAGDIWKGKRTLIICGSGNNGGDGYALAEIMADRGLDVTLLRVSEKFSEDGRFYFAHCEDKKIPVLSCFEAEDPAAVDAVILDDYDIFVDCIFGTGFAGEPREPQAGVIRAVNAERERGAAVIAVDINSGMNGDTGEAALAIKSDLTVSIGYFKHGFFTGKAPELIERLVNVDIGIRLDI